MTAKKIVSDELDIKKSRTKKVVKKVAPVALTLPVKKEAQNLLKESRLETLAMIHHVHGTKAKVSRSGILHLTRISHIVDANWSLWHLTWSIVWRVVFIFTVVWVVALFTVIYFGNLILSR